jgi:hypothetical protein
MCDVSRVSENYCLGFTLLLTNPKPEKTQAAGISSKHTKRNRERFSRARFFRKRRRTKERETEREE